ncbi:MAG: hypothetical protein V1824_03530, partial [archaeon]
MKAIIFNWKNICIDRKFGKYNLESWLSPKLFGKKSKLGGKGLFTKEDIKKGEVVVIWGGKLFTE